MEISTEKMMKKFISQFRTLDIPLQGYFKKLFSLTFITLLLMSLLSIFFKDVVLFFVSLILGLSAFGYFIYQLFNCLENKIGMIEGTCVEIGSSKKRDYATIQSYNGDFIVVYGKRNSLEPGNTAVIYAHTSCLHKKNDDTYSIDSPFYIYIKSKNISSFQNSEEQD